MARIRFGFSDQEWDEMCAETRRVLAEVASGRGTITYGELAMQVSGGRISPRSSALMELLGEVCQESDTQTGTILASLVVRADSGIPGDGYFAYLAAEGRDVSDRETLWRHEVERVWDSWIASDDAKGHQEVRA